MRHSFQAVPAHPHYFKFVHMPTNSLFYNASQKYPSNQNQIYEYTVPWILTGACLEVGITCPTPSNLELNLRKANWSNKFFTTVNSLAVSYQRCSGAPVRVPSGPVDLLLSILLVCFKKAFHVSSVWDLTSDLPKWSFQDSDATGLWNWGKHQHKDPFSFPATTPSPFYSGHLSAIVSFCQRPSVSDMMENFLIISSMPLVCCDQELSYCLLVVLHFLLQNMYSLLIFSFASILKDLF